MYAYTILYTLYNIHIGAGIDERRTCAADREESDGGIGAYSTRECNIPNINIYDHIAHYVQ